MRMAAGGASVPRKFFTARSYSSCLEKIFASGGGGVSDAGVARTSPDPECTPRTQRGTSVTAPHQGSDRPSLRITGAGRGETGERPHTPHPPSKSLERVRRAAAVSESPVIFRPQQWPPGNTCHNRKIFRRRATVMIGVGIKGESPARWPGFLSAQTAVCGSARQISANGNDGIRRGPAFRAQEAGKVADRSG